MEFPRYVFTSPGPEKIPGGSYGTELVNDQDEFDDAIAAGFFATMPEALEDAKKEPEEKEEPVAAESVEEKATEEMPSTPKRGRKPKGE